MHSQVTLCRLFTRGVAPVEDMFYSRNDDFLLRSVVRRRAHFVVQITERSGRNTGGSVCFHGGCEYFRLSQSRNDSHSGAGQSSLLVSFQCVISMINLKVGNVY